MLLNQLRNIQPYVKLGLATNQKRYLDRIISQGLKTQDVSMQQPKPNTRSETTNITQKEPLIASEFFPASTIVPVVLSNKDPIVLSFDDVPGPKSLKYISSFRSYLSEVGTQLTASVLTVGLNVGKFLIAIFT